MAVVELFLTSGTSWQVPSNWTSTNTIECIGGGGGGNGIVVQTGGGDGGFDEWGRPLPPPPIVITNYSFGGGGGAYSKITNLTLNPGSLINYQVGDGGVRGQTGQDTWFNGVSFLASSVGAKAGIGATTSAAGTGGPDYSCIGSVKASGGSGGSDTGSGSRCAGGGGAAGPNGAGGAGTAQHGGAGDNGSGGAGAAPGQGNGFPGTEWSTNPTYGSGGGGLSGSTPGNGGYYGGGGSGDNFGSGNALGGYGARGLIRIVYTTVDPITHYGGGSLRADGGFITSDLLLHATLSAIATLSGSGGLLTRADQIVPLQAGALLSASGGLFVPKTIGPWPAGAKLSASASLGVRCVPEIRKRQKSRLPFTDIRIVNRSNLDGVWTDWLLHDGRLDETLVLANVVKVALMTDRRASDIEILPDPDAIDKRGWWGDYEAVDLWRGWEVGCKNWLLTRAKITPAAAQEGSTLVRAESYTRSALQPLIDQNICSRIDVTATRSERQRIDVLVTIYRGPREEITLEFQGLWDEMTGEH